VGLARVQSKYLRIIFWFYAVLNTLVACYHLVGIFYPINSSPPWRHGLFVIINLFCVYGFLNRPRFFVYFFFLLFLQQLYSHGGNAVAVWIQHRIVSWMDLCVVFFIGLAFVLVWIDRNKRS
jgi:hypothetical protein